MHQDPGRAAERLASIINAIKERDAAAAQLLLADLLCAAWPTSQAQRQ